MPRTKAPVFARSQGQSSNTVSQTAGAIVDRLDRLVDAELARAGTRMRFLDPAQRREVEQMMRRIVARIGTGPVRNVLNSENPCACSVAREMFCVALERRRWSARASYSA